MSFGGFSFGSTPAAAPATAPASSPFGASAAPAPATGGLSGQPAAATRPAASGGLFGQPPAQKAFSGFGAPAASTTPQPSTSLFGQSAQQQPPASTSLFGQPAQQQQQQPSTSLFGQPQQPPSTSLFSQPTQQQQPSTGGLFGQPAQNSSLTVSQLGQPQFSSPLFGNGGFGGQQQQQQQFNGGNSLAVSQQPPPPPLKPEDLPIEQRIDLIKNAWDPSSPACRFKSFFFNVVQPNEVEMYQRPAAANDDAAWFAAVRNNPDPSTMVPVIAVGFADLQKRTEVQTRVAGAHYAKLQEISTRLTSLSKSAHLSLSLRLSRAQLLESQLSHRTLQLIKHLHLLIPTLRSSSIRRDEEALTLRLEALVAELEGGRGKKGESLKGRMVELWGLLGEVKSERERDRNAAGGREGWAVVDENAMNELATIIASQQQALQHVTKILKEDLEAMDVMRQGLGLVKSSKVDGRV